MPVKDKQSNLITSEKEQDESLREHFAEVLNCPEPNEQAHILEADTYLEIDTEEPSKTEIYKDIASLKNNKAPRDDQLPAELFKGDPNLAADILHLLFTKIWHNNTIPTKWSKGNIIKLPKKRYLTNCNNWRGITLLSIPSKRFSRNIIDRIKTTVVAKISQEQADFREGKGCCDQVFNLRNIIKLWKILRHYGVP